MCNNPIKHLAWDSDFFARKIGRIDCDNSLNVSELLNRAKNENYDLIYVFGDKDFFIEEAILQRYNGSLVDRKVLYSRSFSYGRHCGLDPQFAEKKEIAGQVRNDVREYYATELTPELENLAYTSGEFSRFRLDKNFSESDFRRMYCLWIENSVKRQIADFVFVAKESDQIKGMVTLKIADNAGHIGLFAVASEAQGKGYGKSLIQRCENELLIKEIQTLEVPTQKANKNACRFYEKCGFVVKEITNIYHFWL